MEDITDISIVEKLITDSGKSVPPEHENVLSNKHLAEISGLSGANGKIIHPSKESTATVQKTVISTSDQIITDCCMAALCIPAVSLEGSNISTKEKSTDKNTPFCLDNLNENKLISTEEKVSEMDDVATVEQQEVEVDTSVTTQECIIPKKWESAGKNTSLVAVDPTECIVTESNSKINISHEYISAISSGAVPYEESTAPEKPTELGSVHTNYTGGDPVYPEKNQGRTDPTETEEIDISGFGATKQMTINIATIDVQPENMIDFTEKVESDGKGSTKQEIPSGNIVPIVKDVFTGEKLVEALILQEDQTDKVSSSVVHVDSVKMELSREAAISAETYPFEEAVANVKTIISEKVVVSAIEGIIEETGFVGPYPFDEPTVSVQEKPFEEAVISAETDLFKETIVSENANPSEEDIVSVQATPCEEATVSLKSDAQQEAMASIQVDHPEETIAFVETVHPEETTISVKSEQSKGVTVSVKTYLPEETIASLDADLPEEADLFEKDITSVELGQSEKNISVEADPSEETVVPVKSDISEEVVSVSTSPSRKSTVSSEAELLERVFASVEADTPDTTTFSVEKNASGQFTVSVKADITEESTISVQACQSEETIASVEVDSSEEVHVSVEANSSEKVSASVKTDSSEEVGIPVEAEISEEVAISTESEKTKDESSLKTDSYNDPAVSIESQIFDEGIVFVKAELSLGKAVLTEAHLITESAVSIEQSSIGQLTSENIKDKNTNTETSTEEDLSFTSEIMLEENNSDTSALMKLAEVACKKVQLNDVSLKTDDILTDSSSIKNISDFSGVSQSKEVDLPICEEKSKTTETIDAVRTTVLDSVCMTCRKLWSDEILLLLFEGRESVTVHSSITYGAILCMETYALKNNMNIDESIKHVLDSANFCQKFGFKSIATICTLIEERISDKIITCCDRFRPIYQSNKSSPNKSLDNKLNDTEDKTVDSCNKKRRLDEIDLVFGYPISKGEHSSVGEIISETNIESDMITKKLKTESSSKNLENFGTPNDAPHQFYEFIKQFKSNGNYLKKSSKSLKIFLVKEKKSLPKRLQSIYDCLYFNEQYFDKIDGTYRRLMSDHELIICCVKCFDNIEGKYNTKLLFSLVSNLLHFRGNVLLIPGKEALLSYIIELASQKLLSENFDDEEWDENEVYSVPITNQELNDITIRDVIAHLCTIRKTRISNFKDSLFMRLKSLNVDDVVGFTLRVYAMYCDIVFCKQNEAKARFLLNLDANSNYSGYLVTTDLKVFPPKHASLDRYIQFYRDKFSSNYDYESLSKENQDILLEETSKCKYAIIDFAEHATVKRGLLDHVAETAQDVGTKRIACDESECSKPFKSAKTEATDKDLLKKVIANIREDNISPNDMLRIVGIVYREIYNIDVPPLSDIQDVLNS